MFSVGMKEVDGMNKRNKNRVKAGLCDLFVTGRGHMIGFDFKQDGKALDRANLLPNNTQAALVRDLKTNLIIMVCCKCSDYNPTSGTAVGLSDVLKVMANRWIDKAMQCSNWTMDNNLSQKAREYGAFHT